MAVLFIAWKFIEKQELSCQEIPEKNKNGSDDFRNKIVDKQDISKYP